MTALNPFSDEAGEASGLDPVRRLRSGAARIRGLKAQVGHDGLTPSATRTLIDELTAALEAVASALEEKGGR